MYAAYHPSIYLRGAANSAVNARCYVDIHVDKLSDSHFFHVISLKGDLNLGFFFIFLGFSAVF